MKLFIDTANIDEIKEISDLGIIDGVTTNPSLIAKEGRDFKSVVQEITSIIDGPISAEVISTDAEGMLKEAEDLVQIHPNIVIKLPLIEQGIKATSILSKKGIKTNVTLCFSPMQALLAAKAGATYVSPFIGRLDDISHDGPQLIRDIIEIYENFDYPTEVIAASIRHPIHVLEAAKARSHIATIPLKVIKQLFNHPLTDIGLEKFLKDWKTMK
ncbi:MAG TPA: fructose-6-phosphate aldolase [Spirochaetes bacterium]|nr:fructose-6-phosphate aldolase [Spirochaetota bacterium]